MGTSGGCARDARRRPPRLGRLCGSNLQDQLSRDEIDSSNNHDEDGRFAAVGSLVHGLQTLLVAITGFVGLRMTINGVELRDDSPLKGEEVLVDFLVMRR